MVDDPSEKAIFRFFKPANVFIGMKSHKHILLLIFLISLLACEERKEITIAIEDNSTAFDTLFIQDIYSGKTLMKVPLTPSGKGYSFPLEETILAELAVKGVESTYLTVLSPGEKKSIAIDPSSLRTLKSLTDSLANYLWRSTNLMFSMHDKTIFAEDKPGKVRDLFDSLVQVRKDQLKGFESILSKEEMGLLTYQNEARAYSFLMFYGRIIKEIPLGD